MNDRRRRHLVLGLTLLLVTGSAILWRSVARHDAGDAWAGIPVIGRAVRPMRFDPPPTSYRIRYRVLTGSPLRATRIEVLSVARPWRSLLQLDDTGGGSALRVDEASDKTRLLFAQRSGAPTVFPIPPDLASNDSRIDATLADAVARGWAALLSRRRIAGRECQVVRTTAAPEEAVPLAAISGARSYVDTCYDDRGLLLGQVRIQDQAAAEARFAQAVEIDVGLPPYPIPPPSLAGTATAGTVRPIPAEKPLIGGRWTLTPPRDWSFAGRVAFAAPAGSSDVAGGSAERRAGYQDTWIRGNDVLLLEWGGTLFGSRPFAPQGASLPPGPGESTRAAVLYGLRLSAILIELPGGQYIRAAGTVSLQTLTSIALTLRRIE